MNKSLFLKISLSLLLLILAFRNINFLQVIAHISLVGIPYLLLFIFILLHCTYIVSIRWAMLIKKNLIEPNQFYWQTFRANMIGNFYGLLLPTTIGGDFIKWKEISDISSKKFAFFSIMVDRIVGLVGVIILCCIGLIISSFSTSVFLPHVIYVISIILSVCILFSITLIILLAYYHQNIPLLSKNTNIKAAVMYIKDNMRRLLGALMLTVTSQMLYIFMIYMVAQRLNIHLSFLHFLIIVPLISLFTTLPISFAGFGITEIGYLALLTPLYVENTQVLALTTFLTFLKVTLSGIGWFFIHTKKKY